MQLNKNKVDELMFLQNKTQKQLAKEINTSAVWLSNVLNSTNIASNMAHRIAKGLGVDVREIIKMED